MPTPDRSLIVRVTDSWPPWNSTSRIGGVPASSTAGSSPQRLSCTMPLRAMACVDNVSLGNALRSTKTTSCPAEASSKAVAAPAHLAPTTTTSAQWVGLVS